MKRSTKRFRRFYIDDVTDMEDYNDIINDPFCTIILRESMDEKTITSDNEGNSRTEIRPTYLVHWEELKI